MASLRRENPVAVFDSGVGGISVLRTLRKILPQENYIYFGDSANAPYGEKNVDEVRIIASEAARRLIEYGAKAIVIACNTATSAAAVFLRQAYPDVPIIGMEPAVKPASTVCESPTVLVMATPLTLREKKFRSLIDRCGGKAEFIDVPCHGLVEMVERGITSGVEMEALLHSILDGYLFERKVDAAVLGCTHYIHARKSICSVLGKEVRVFDGALGTACEVKRRLREADLLNNTKDNALGSVEIYNSAKDHDKMLDLSYRLLGLEE